MTYSRCVGDPDYLPLDKLLLSVAWSQTSLCRFGLINPESNTLSLDQNFCEVSKRSLYLSAQLYLFNCFCNCCFSGGLRKRLYNFIVKILLFFDVNKILWIFISGFSVHSELSLKLVQTSFELIQALSWVAIPARKLYAQRSCCVQF